MSRQPAGPRGIWPTASRSSCRHSSRRSSIPRWSGRSQVLAGSTFRLFSGAQDHETADTGDAFVVTHRSGTPLDLEVELHLPESGRCSCAVPGLVCCVSPTMVARLRWPLSSTRRSPGDIRWKSPCATAGHPDLAGAATSTSHRARRMSHRGPPGGIDPSPVGRASEQPALLRPAPADRAGQGQAEGAYHAVLSDGSGAEYEGTVLLPGHQAMLNQLFCEITPALRGSAYQRKPSCATSAVAWRRALPSEIVDVLRGRAGIQRRRCTSSAAT